MFYTKAATLSLLWLFLVSPAVSTEYRFCVSCDTHRAQTTISSGAADFGREWYRVKTGMLFQKAYSAQGCSVSEFSEAECGLLPNEELVFVAVNGDQISALLSGNPVLIGQTLVEIVVGIPVAAYDWIASWFD